MTKPDYQIVFFGDAAWQTNKSKPLPQKDITIRLALLDDGRVVKIVRNSNYIGEYKKGVFASEDWVAKTRRGGIFLHAGCREDYLQSAHGAYRPVRTLLIALSANGKTTTTCKILARKGMERSWLIQDDGGTLMPDGSFHGFEAGGVFVKTEGVNPGEQVEIFYGLLKAGDGLRERLRQPRRRFRLRELRADVQRPGGGLAAGTSCTPARISTSKLSIISFSSPAGRSSRPSVN